MASRLTVTAGGVALEHPFDVSWTKQANAAGSGSFSLSTDDAQAAGIDYGDVVAITKDGVAAFSFVVRSRRKVDVDGDEARGQVWTFSGPGLIDELSYLPILPPLGLVTSTSGQTTGLKIARSPWADDRLYGWVDPVRGGLLNQSPDASDNLTRTTGTARPIGWPDDDAYWIGNSAGGSVNYHAALIASGDLMSNRAILWVAFKDEGEVYWNGVLVAQVTASEADPTKCQRVSLEVTPNQPNVLSVKVRKVAGISSRPEFAFTLHEVGGSGNFLLRTRGPEQDWGMFTDPTTPPGISAGEIIVQAFENTIADGYPSDWFMDFDEVNDSNGDPWPVIPIWPERIGGDMFSMLQRLSESWVDFRWTADRHLQMVSAAGVDLPGGGTAPGFGSSSGITGAVGTNALQLVHEGTSEIRNSMLSRWVGGWARFEDTASVTAHGRQHGSLQTGDLADIDAVRQVAESNLGVTKAVTDSIIAEMDDITSTSGYSAYVDYDVFDTVVWPTIDGDSAAVKCMAITVTEDENGYLDVTPEFITARDVLEQRLARWLTRTNDGALAGKSQTATRTSVSSPSVLSSATVSPVEVTFSATGDYELVTGDETGPGKTPDVTGFFYRIELECNAAGTSSTLISITVNGTAVATGTLPASTVSATYDLTSSQTLIVESGDVLRAVVLSGGGHTGVTVRCLISSIEL